jgi:hypothetical protein
MTEKRCVDSKVNWRPTTYMKQSRSIGECKKRDTRKKAYAVYVFVEGVL